ncbi:helix-turn-helix transcriptional regulator [Streptomyces sp. NPDC047869]|uniref:helix-turn-helix domain-containing protein n=1 Tax=Streptomyces sp. NPDC047869 TaxID=3154709 RepID=UPI00345374C7
MTGDDFPELLGRLKERSGLSYGVLGKRLHTSASTLHRYVNGDAVPTDYAPVERFARLCRATPEELVELHRRWVLADARRRQRASGAAEAGTGAAVAEEPSATGPEGTGGGAEAPAAAGTAEAEAPAVSAAAEPGAPHASGTAEPEAPAPAGTAGARAEGEVRGSAGARVARRRAVVLAGAGVAAAVVSAALVANLLSGEGGGELRRAGDPSTGTMASQPVSGSAGAPGTGGAKSGSPAPSASRGAGPPASASASATRGGGAGAARGGGYGDGATAPAVAVDPYKWEDPCSQHYLVDRQPEQVPPPPGEPDARGWVTALGGVAGGQQMLALTVQGTGSATVVLEDLHVRVVEKSAPLAWNDFAMGVGCGGGVGTAAFGTDLDAGRPALTPKAGQRDFPYKVSESDPEVFYVFADARAHNVSWYLELDWSSGARHGTVRVDDNGKPFRTSGNVGRPAYSHPLGSSEWGPSQPG